MIFLLNEGRERWVNDSLFTRLDVWWNGPWQWQDTSKPDFTSLSLRFPTLSQLGGGGGHDWRPCISRGSWIILLLIFPGETFKMFLRVWVYKVKWTVPWGQSFVFHRASWNKTDHWIEWSVSGVYWLVNLFQYVFLLNLAFSSGMGHTCSCLKFMKRVRQTLTVHPFANRQLPVMVSLGCACFVHVAAVLCGHILNI